MKHPKVSFQELESAFDFASHGQPEETMAFLCRETGQTYFYSEIIDLDEALPDDIDEEDKYIRVPHKQELGLGKPLVLQFAQELMPDAFDKVREIFSHRGAFARFKDLLEYRDMLPQWYAYEEAACERALREWCEDQQIEVED